ncbi:hypothetical protein SELMODRAFT_72195, partial [Selaginella moellendorffii]
LVETLGKFGQLEEVSQAFARIRQPNVFSWNIMVAAYAQNGRLEESRDMFEEKMAERDGVRPDEITFMIVLHACSHLGLVEESLRQFASMVVDHAEAPRVEHRACVVDVLGRVGELDGAEDVVGSLPASSGALAWTTLTGAAKMHGAVGHGVRGANAVFRMDPSDSAPYVLL